MPSTHTQVIAYLLGANIILLSRTSPYLFKLQRFQRAAELCFLISATAAIAFARVYLGYHTVLQVVFGALVGTMFGVVWTKLSNLVIVRNQAWLQQSWLASHFGVQFEHQTGKSRTA